MITFWRSSDDLSMPKDALFEWRDLLDLLKESTKPDGACLALRTQGLRNFRDALRTLQDKAQHDHRVREQVRRVAKELGSLLQSSRIIDTVPSLEYPDFELCCQSEGELRISWGDVENRLEEARERTQTERLFDDNIMATPMRALDAARNFVGESFGRLAAISGEIMVLDLYVSHTMKSFERAMPFLIALREAASKHAGGTQILIPRVPNRHPKKNDPPVTEETFRSALKPYEIESLSTDNVDVEFADVTDEGRALRNHARWLFFTPTNVALKVDRGFQWMPDTSHQTDSTTPSSLAPHHLRLEKIGGWAHDIYEDARDSASRLRI